MLPHHDHSDRAAPTNILHKNRLCHRSLAICAWGDPNNLFSINKKRMKHTTYRVGIAFGRGFLGLCRFLNRENLIIENFLGDMQIRNHKGDALRATSTCPPAYCNTELPLPTFTL